MMSSNSAWQTEADFKERVRTNQQVLRAALKPQYDFIVCGSGSSGSVVARRLAENPEVNVLPEGREEWSIGQGQIASSDSQPDSIAR